MRNHHLKNQPAIDLVRRHPLPEHYPYDTGWWTARYWGLLLMALLLALSIYLFLSTNRWFENFQGNLARVEDNDSARIRQYNQQLESLQNRMTTFVADSVETKLKTLEKNVAAGTVGTQEIKILEELKGEVRLLENYSAGKGGNLTDLSRLDHPRFQTTPGSSVTASAGDLAYEISRMKYLLYLGIASCGLVGLMLSGYCWQIHSRVKRLSGVTHKSRLLDNKFEADV